MVQLKTLGLTKFRVLLLLAVTFCFATIAIDHAIGQETVEANISVVTESNASQHNVLPESFEVRDCTGAAAGKTVCYYCRYAKRPTICLFVRNTNDETVDLIAKLEELVIEHRGARLASFVVLISEDKEAAEERLKKIAVSKNIRFIPLTIYRDQKEKLEDAFLFSEDSPAKLTFWNDQEIKSVADLTEEKTNKGKRDSFIEFVRTELTGN